MQGPGYLSSKAVVDVTKEVTSLFQDSSIWGSSFSQTYPEPLLADDCLPLSSP